MHNAFVITGMLAGGLGLFLLAVTMITDGLKSTVGRSLRDMLTSWTRTPLHGIFTGLTITAIVQSSSAVTVATIGFVNAGLINMRQALGIVYGSNVGTTMTGWLVAIIGFKINVDAFALPMIGVGMLLRLTGGQGKRGPLGVALVGFGLFFMGIDVLKDAFDSLVVAIDLTKFTADGVLGIFMFVAIGFLMTVLTQSSSAAIAITLTAATGGIIGLYAAGAMVIGANVGTTSTAAVAVIGATPNAKRVAWAHIIFNLITGLVALVLLPLMFWTVEYISELMGFEAMPAITLALFHTLFNLLGVGLIFPLNNHLARFLEQRFVTQEEIEGRPQYLDRTVAVSSELAVNAIILELSRLATIVRRMALEALSGEFAQTRRLSKDYMTVKSLSDAISDFINLLGREALSHDVSDQLARLLRAEQHLLACASQALQFSDININVVALEDSLVLSSVSSFRAEVVNLVSMADLDNPDYSVSDLDLQLEQVQAAYQNSKEALLLAGAELQIPIAEMISIMDQNSEIRRMARQMIKSMHLLNELSVVTAAKETTQPVID